MVPSTSALVFYLLFLPLVAMQRLMNPGSCAIGSIERLLRARWWRNPEAAREGPLVSRGVLPVLGVEPNPSTADIVSFGAIFVLWLLGLIHLSMLGDPALLSIFP